MPRVADLIVESLNIHGVDRAFSVPGESFLGLLDALYDDSTIDLVTCRHEGSAALAAVADAKLTGKPGIVMVSRGPGAFNAALGLHVAQQEAIPLVVFVGQVDLPNLGRDAVQEINSARNFNGVLKWSARIDSPAMAGEILARAFSTAVSGTPGPVMIELPEDVLVMEAGNHLPRAHGAGGAEPSASAMKQVATMLAAARKPLLLVGGECRTPEFRDDIVRLSDTWNLPVLATNKGQDQFPNLHPNWAGQLGFFASPAQMKLFGQADLILAVGSRLGDLSTIGFSFPIQEPVAQKLIHVYPDASQIGTHFQTHLPVVSTALAFVKAMVAETPTTKVDTGWMADVTAAREATTFWKRDAIPTDDIMGHTVSAIFEHFASDGVVTTDSGNFAGWVHRIFRLNPTNRLLGSACGAMGTGVPSGLAAALRHPGRQVVAFCGDGGFLMTGTELATAVARYANLKIVVSNNGSYGTIRSHQQKHFPRRVSGTDLSNPDFAAMARAFGAKGFTVRTAAEASSIIAEAMKTDGPVLIEVVSDVDQTLEKSVVAMRA